MDRTPLSFFLKGLAGLAVLFVVTLLMEPTPMVDALRVVIGVGAAVVVLKIGLWSFGIDFPRRRR